MNTKPLPQAVPAPAPAPAPAPQPRDFSWFPKFLFAPTIVFLVVMTLFPLLFSLVISFTDYSLGRPFAFVGFGNYQAIFRDPYFWGAALNTVKITVIAVGVEIAFGLLLAFLFNLRLPGSGFLRVIIFIPMMLSPLVIGFFWKFMYDQIFGIITWFLSLFGATGISFLTHPTRAMLAIISVDVWQWTPFVFLLLLAGLQTVPPELYEAAALDKASWWMRFRNITMPYLRFPLMIALLFRTIDTIKIFDLVYILTGGGPGDATLTLSVMAFRFGFQFYQIGKAAAVSWLIVVLINVLAMLLINLLTGKQQSRRPVAQEGAGDRAGR